MIKILNYTDQVILRQKGWILFSTVIGLQMLFLAINYLIYGE